jgi:methyl-accepting chemotaxis protein
MSGQAEQLQATMAFFKLAGSVAALARNQPAGRAAAALKKASNSASRSSGGSRSAAAGGGQAPAESLDEAHFARF